MLSLIASEQRFFLEWLYTHNKRLREGAREAVERTFVDTFKKEVHHKMLDLVMDQRFRDAMKLYEASLTGFSFPFGTGALQIQKMNVMIQETLRRSLEVIKGNISAEIEAFGADYKETAELQANQELDSHIRTITDIVVEQYKERKEFVQQDCSAKLSASRAEAKQAAAQYQLTIEQLQNQVNDLNAKIAALNFKCEQMEKESEVKLEAALRAASPVPQYVPGAQTFNHRTSEAVSRGYSVFGFPNSATEMRRTDGTDPSPRNARPSDGPSHSHTDMSHPQRSHSVYPLPNSSAEHLQQRAQSLYPMPQHGPGDGGGRAQVASFAIPYAPAETRLAHTDSRQSLASDVNARGPPKKSESQKSLVESASPRNTRLAEVEAGNAESPRNNIKSSQSHRHLPNVGELPMRTYSVMGMPRYDSSTPRPQPIYHPHLARSHSPTGSQNDGAHVHYRSVAADAESEVPESVRCSSPLSAGGVSLASAFGPMVQSVNVPRVRPKISGKDISIEETKADETAYVGIVANLVSKPLDITSTPPYPCVLEASTSTTVVAEQNEDISRVVNHYLAAIREGKARERKLMADMERLELHSQEIERTLRASADEVRVDLEKKIEAERNSHNVQWQELQKKIKDKESELATVRLRSNCLSEKCVTLNNLTERLHLETLWLMQVVHNQCDDVTKEKVKKLRMELMAMEVSLYCSEESGVQPRLTQQEGDTAAEVEAVGLLNYPIPPVNVLSKQSHAVADVLLSHSYEEQISAMSTQLKVALDRVRQLEDEKAKSTKAYRREREELTNECNTRIVKLKGALRVVQKRFFLLHNRVAASQPPLQQKFHGKFEKLLNDMNKLLVQRDTEKTEVEAKLWSEKRKNEVMRSLISKNLTDDDVANIAIFNKLSEMEPMEEDEFMFTQLKSQVHNALQIPLLPTYTPRTTSPHERPPSATRRRTEYMNDLIPRLSLARIADRDESSRPSSAKISGRDQPSPAAKPDSPTRCSDGDVLLAVGTVLEGVDDIPTPRADSVTDSIAAVKERPQANPSAFPSAAPPHSSSELIAEILKTSQRVVTTPRPPPRLKKEDAIPHSSPAAQRQAPATNRQWARQSPRVVRREEPALLVKGTLSGRKQ